MQESKIIMSWMVGILLFSMSNPLYSQALSPSMEQWQSLLNKPGLADYFSDVFLNLGLVVEDTDEQFTVHHKGDHFALSSGLTENEVDYVVNVNAQNIANMLDHGKEGNINDDESFEILSVMFTPLTQSSLDAPMLSKPLMQKLAGIENHIHVYLMNETSTKSTAHTLIFINKKWTVIEGIHGDAKRVFKMNPSQALEYQKHMFRAIQADKAKEWRKFKKWYKQWRTEVSVTG